MSTKSNEVNHILFESVFPKNKPICDKKLFLDDTVAAINRFKKRTDEVLDAIKNESKFYGYDTKNLIALIAPSDSPLAGSFIIQDLKKDKPVMIIKLYNVLSHS